MEYDPTIFQVTDNTDILDGLVFELPKIDNSSDKTSTNVNLESTQIGTYDPAIFQVTDDSAVLNNLVLKLPRKKVPKCHLPKKIIQLKSRRKHFLNLIIPLEERNA